MNKKAVILIIALLLSVTIVVLFYNNSNQMNNDLQLKSDDYIVNIPEEKIILCLLNVKSDNKLEGIQLRPRSDFSIDANNKIVINDMQLMPTSKDKILCAVNLGYTRFIYKSTDNIMKETIEYLNGNSSSSSIPIELQALTNDRLKVTLNKKSSVLKPGEVINNSNSLFGTLDLELKYFDMVNKNDMVKK